MLAENKHTFKYSRKLCTLLNRGTKFVLRLSTKQTRILFAQYVAGNPKTLTPDPRTPTTDRIHGLPTDRSTDYPYRPLYGSPPNKVEITKIEISLAA